MPLGRDRSIQGKPLAEEGETFKKVLHFLARIFWSIPIRRGEILFLTFKVKRKVKRLY